MRHREREEDRQDINALKVHNIGSDKYEVVINGLIESTLSFSQAASKLDFHPITSPIVFIRIHFSRMDCTSSEFSIILQKRPTYKV